MSETQNGTSPKAREPLRGWPNDIGFNTLVELPEPVELTVTGSIPAQVAGTLYRTGPGSYKVEGTDYERSHWFDGFSQLHRFEMIAQPDGTCKVLYNSRRQNDPLIEKAKRDGTLKEITFAQKRDPCETFFQKLKSAFQPAGNETRDPGMAIVNVTVHANSPVTPAKYKTDSGRFHSVTTLTDFNSHKHLDPITLEPRGLSQQKWLHPDLKGPVSCAHAEFDPETGDYFNYNLDFGMHPTYRIFRTAAETGETEVLATISGRDINAAYIHSFFLTQNYVILCIWPAVFGAGGARVLWERTVMDAFEFDPKLEARWCVVDRRHGRGLVATFVSPAFFAFHSINAWEEETDKGGAATTVDIVCDIIRFPNTDILSRMYYDNLLSTGTAAGRFYGTEESTPYFTRSRLPGVPKKGSLQGTPAVVELVNIKNTSAVGELPTINPRYSTKPSRYFYNPIDRGLSSFMDGLAKVDIETKESKVWAQDKHTPGEAIFVPDGTDEAEDAGYLLSVVLNGETGTSSLVCLNARDMTEVGRADCGVPVGFGFHGAHYPTKL